MAKKPIELITVERKLMCLLINEQTKLAVRLTNEEYFFDSFGPMQSPDKERYYSSYEILDKLEKKVRHEFFDNEELNPSEFVTIGDHSGIDAIFELEGLYELEEDHYLLEYSFNSTVS